MYLLPENRTRALNVYLQSLGGGGQCLGGHTWMDRWMDEEQMDRDVNGTNDRVPNPNCCLPNMTFFELFGLLGRNSNSTRKNSSGHPLYKCALLDKLSWYLAAFRSQPLSPPLPTTATNQVFSMEMLRYRWRPEMAGVSTHALSFNKNMPVSEKYLGGHTKALHTRPHGSHFIPYLVLKWFINRYLRGLGGVALLI